MIKVNGEPLKFKKGMTVTDVIRAKNFNFPLLIVKIDGVYIAREAYSATEVPDKSDVEVVHLISGG